MSDEVVDAAPHDIAATATGLLRQFNVAGVLSAADVHVADRLRRLGGEPDEQVLLAVALAVRGVRLGSVCIELARVRETVGEVAVDADLHAERRIGVDALHWPDLHWPDPGAWLGACRRSPLVAGAAPAETAPMRLVHDLLYLDRYWRQELVVRTELDARVSAADLPVDANALTAALSEHFAHPATGRQRLAGAMAARRPLTVLAGGPGTGKTATVARLVALLSSLGGEPRIALAAPTGKAAARLNELMPETVDGQDPLAASTIHRLLGSRPDSRSRFRHHRDNHLPYDVVIVDEMSMVSLTLMARLLEAVRPDARLVLVGDPDQLASVEAGAVLGDVVKRPAPAAAAARPVPAEAAGLDLDDEALRNGVVTLKETFRFGSEIDALATAIRANDADRVLDVLRQGGSAVTFIECEPDSAPTPDAEAVQGLRADVEAAAAALTAAAQLGDVERALKQLTAHRLLCAHRRGPYGVSWWSRIIERWLATSQLAREPGEWYIGQPLLVDTNDYDLRLFNGDTGVVVAREGRLMAVFLRGGEPLLVSPGRLADVRTVHAMTVHRAQGSQFDRVSLLLPPPQSPLLTRELLYTAVTRAEKRVRVIGSAAAVRRAVERPISRASGLQLPAEP